MDLDHRFLFEFTYGATYDDIPRWSLRGVRLHQKTIPVSVGLIEGIANVGLSFEG